MAQNMPEPPTLKTSRGETIVQFRRPDGSFFSNHPEYPAALALHEDRLARGEVDETGAPIEEDTEQAPDDGDGNLTYSEMASKDLLAEVDRRGLERPKPVKRSALIEILEQNDSEKQ